MGQKGEEPEFLPSRRTAARTEYAVTLPAQIWDALRLSLATVEARARFYRAYAVLDQVQFDVRNLAESFRNGRVTDEDEAGNATESAAHPLPVGAMWVRVGEVADALRNAAIAELLVNMEQGRKTLIEAGRSYRQMGLPFGGYLITAAAGGRDISTVAVRQLRNLVGDLQVDLTGPLGQEAIYAPAQQCYLLITAAREATDLSSRLAEAPQALSSRAIGTTSQPLSTWWRFGQLLSGLLPDVPEDRTRLARIIGELGEAHGRQLDLAMRDEYHWARGQSAADLVDLDLACAVAISVRAMRHRDIRRWNIRTDFADLTPLGAVSIQVGIQLGEPEIPQSGEPTVGGPHPFPDPPGDGNFGRQQEWSAQP
jgi:hypothetical protein